MSILNSISKTRVDTTFWVERPLNGLPFTPLSLLGPEMDQVVYQCAVELVITLQEKAQDNRGRTVVYNLLSRNGYENPEWHEVLTDTVLFANIELNPRKLGSPEEVFRYVAREYLSLYTANLIVTNRDLSYGLPSDIIHKVNNLAGKYGVLKSKLGLNAYKNNRRNDMHNQPGAGWNQHPTQPGYPPHQQPMHHQPMYNQPPQIHHPQPMYQQPQPMYSHTPMYNQPHQPPMYNHHHHSAYHNPVEKRSVYTTNNNSMHAPVNQNARTRWDNRQPVAHQNNMVTEHWDNQQTQNNHEPVVEVSYDDDLPEWSPDRPFDVIEENGLQWIAKHLTDLRKSWDTINPYSEAFNPNEYIPYVAKTSDGKVEERLFEVKEGMEYLSHEVTVVGTVTKPNDGKVVPNWEEFKDAVDATKNNPDIDNIELDKISKSVKMREIIKGPTKDALRFKVESIVANDGVKLPLNEVINYDGQIITPFIIRKDDMDITTRYLDVLFDSDSIEEWVSHMENLSNDRRFSPRITNMLVSRATDILNEGLKCGLGLGVEVDNILTDWEHLSNTWFVERLDSDKGTVLLNKLRENVTRRIVTGDGYYVRDDKFKQAVRDSGYVSNDAVIETLTGVAFISRCNITNVNWYLSDLGLNLDNGTAVIKRSKMLNLYDVLDTIVKLNSIEGKRVYDINVITLDGALLKITTGYFDSKHLLLSYVPTY